MAGKKDKKKGEEFYSFDDVLAELKVNEDELNKMVSEGELRAFRDDEVINFKKEDIDNLKKGKITEPTVPLSSEELLGPVESVDKEALVEETVSVTEEVPFADEDITITDLEEEKPLEIDAEDQKTFVEGETGAVTIPLETKESEATFVEEAPPEVAEPIAKQAAEIVVEKPPDEQLLPPAPKPAPPDVKPRPSRVRPLAVPILEVKIQPIYIVLIGVTFLVLLFVGSLLSDTFRISTGRANSPVGITRELGKLVVGIFGIKDEDGENIDLDKYKP